MFLRLFLPSLYVSLLIFTRSSAVQRFFQPLIHPAYHLQISSTLTTDSFWRSSTCFAPACETIHIDDDGIGSLGLLFSGAYDDAHYD